MATFPAVFKMCGRAHVGHECRTEAGEAFAAKPPHASITNAVGARLQQLVCQRLRGIVAIRIMERSELGIVASNIVEFRIEVGEIFPHLHACLEYADLGELVRAMVDHFRMRGLEVEGGIPGAAVSVVEPAAMRAR